MHYIIPHDCSYYTSVDSAFEHNPKTHFKVEVDDNHLNVMGEQDILQDLLYVFMQWPHIDYDLLNRNHAKLIE